MKKYAVFLRSLMGLLTAILAMAFMIIEGYRLLSGEWLLDEIAAVAFFQVALRMLIALYALLLGVLTLIRRKPLPLAALCLFSALLAMAPFLSNGFGLYLSLFSGLFMLFHLPTPINRCQDQCR